MSDKRCANSQLRAVYSLVLTCFLAGCAGAPHVTPPETAAATKIGIVVPFGRCRAEGATRQTKPSFRACVPSC